MRRFSCSIPILSGLFLSVSLLTTAGCSGESDDDDDSSTPICASNDSDCDGYPAESTVRGLAFSNVVSAQIDCDDHNEEIYPGAEEVCDFRDNDCDGEVDEGFPTTAWWEDIDNDGFGTIYKEPGIYCDRPGDAAEQSGDCADMDPAVHPGVCDGIDGADSDCDGAVDEDTCTSLDENQEYGVYSR